MDDNSTSESHFHHEIVAGHVKVITTPQPKILYYVVAQALEYDNVDPELNRPTHPYKELWYKLKLPHPTSAPPPRARRHRVAPNTLPMRADPSLGPSSSHQTLGRTSQQLDHMLNGTPFGQPSQDTHLAPCSTTCKCPVKKDSKEPIADARRCMTIHCGSTT